ncbi:MAG: 3-phosphoshikimate 1-carboxyvinyltransferase [Gammaproteobacteria bacterium]|nr:3-phosphoshikimate 1-carboxyvinyltransferase [Gammaproteobacteria bacterium]
MLQQRIKSVNGPVSGVITVPGSKSLSNRALLLASFSEGVTHLKGVLWSDDTEACFVALQSLGVPIQKISEHELKITGVRVFKQNQKINCRDAGTVSRFLIPIAAALGGSYEFYGSDRLSERPLKPMLDGLIALGVNIIYHDQVGFLPLRVESQGLHGGVLNVDIKDSSQFISGLLLAAPKAKAPITIFADHLAEKPYVHLTLEMMADFGVQAELQGNAIQVMPSSYQACQYEIEPDASTASYFFAAAALTAGEIRVNGLYREVLQGDIHFLEVLEKMGAVVRETPLGITVAGPQILKGLGEVDFSGMSDTFMTLAALCPFADSPTTIKGLRHTRLQESDRVEAMRQGLTVLGAKVTTTEDSITIYPSSLHAGVIDSHRDHRIAMSHALIGLKIPGVIIDGADCVKKTCPLFFELLASLQAI